MFFCAWLCDTAGIEVETGKTDEQTSMAVPDETGRHSDMTGDDGDCGETGKTGDEIGMAIETNKAGKTGTGIDG